MTDRTADTADAHAALAAAASVMAAAAAGAWKPPPPRYLTDLAETAYRWLRRRDSLRAASITLTPGTPRAEGTPDMTTVFNLNDTDQVEFTLQAQDAKGAPVDVPADTWTWALADPDASGAVLTVAGDTLSAVVAAGTPDANLMLSVSGDASGLAGAEAIIVQATAAATIGLVAGTPVPEA